MFTSILLALAPPPSPLPLLFVGEVVALDGWGRAIFFVFFFFIFLAFPVACIYYGQRMLPRLKQDLLLYVCPDLLWDHSPVYAGVKSLDVRLLLLVILLITHVFLAVSVMLLDKMP